jgi:ABC-type branched-subunit amino acid transport system ATPase component
MNHAELAASVGKQAEMVEQNVQATLKMVDQTMILRSGRIVFQGSAQELGGNTDLWKWF